MKALILAGGRGKRFGVISEEQNKCMLKVNGKYLIEYSLDCVSKTNISEIIVVVGYRAQEITSVFGNNHKSKPVKYVTQSEQKGLVHAIECAKEAIGGDDFILMLGDELMINPCHQEMISVFEKENLFGICGVVAVDDLSLIKKTYSIVQSQDGSIQRLIEKPTNPVNNIMGTGNCIFKNRVLSYVDRTPVNPKRGEKELPDLIQCCVDEGNIVKSFQICRHYVNINQPEEIKRAQSYFAHF